MARRVSTVGSCFVLLLMLLTMVPVLPRVEAQNAETIELGVELPEGVTFEVLSQGRADALPDAPLQLRLDRLDVPTGPSGGTIVAPGPELFHIEAGKLVFVDELGIEGHYPNGTSLLIPDGIPYDLRNDGATATALRLVAVPAGEVGGTPGEIVEVRLFDHELAVAPTVPVRLFIALLKFDPGAVVEGVTFSAPVGLVPVSGTLSITGRSGIEGQLTRGVALPADLAVRQRNTGDEPAVVLVAGVLTVGETLFGRSGPAASVVSTGDATAVAQGPEPASESGTTVEPLAPGVLYEATVDGGFEDWPLVGPWEIVEGMLVSTTSGESAILAPVSTGGITNYAIEAEIQLGEAYGSGLSFRLLARQGLRGPGTEVIGRITRDGSGIVRRIYIGSDSASEQRGTYDREWHTYRLEIRGNEVWLEVDGRVVGYATDDRLVSSEGGKVGISIDLGAQITVRRFTLYNLSLTSNSSHLIDVSVQVADLHRSVSNPQRFRVGRAVPTLVNNDVLPHMATGYTSAVQLDRPTTGDTRGHTFNVLGLYRNCCEFHSEMQGSILVVDEASGEDDP